MSSSNKNWAQWAVQYINDKNTCPGLAPEGVPSDVPMPEAIFVKEVAGKFHPADTCAHFMNERLGTPLPGGMVEIKGHGASEVTSADVEKGKKVKSPSGPSKAVDRLKREFHVLVDTIEMREGGVLHIPSQLLKPDSFIKQFFEIV